MQVRIRNSVLVFSVCSIPIAFFARFFEWLLSPAPRNICMPHFPALNGPFIHKTLSCNKRYSKLIIDICFIEFMAEVITVLQKFRMIKFEYPSYMCPVYYQNPNIFFFSYSFTMPTFIHCKISFKVVFGQNGIRLWLIRIYTKSCPILSTSIWTTSW